MPPITFGTLYSEALDISGLAAPTLGFWSQKLCLVAWSPKYIYKQVQVQCAKTHVVCLRIKP